MQRHCEHCERRFSPKSPKAKFCSDRCRRDAYEARRAGKAAQPSGIVPMGAIPAVDGPITAATRRELVEVSREESALGQGALFAAIQLDAGRVSGTSAAAMLARLEVLLAKATATGRSETSATDSRRDELAARRQRRGA